VFNPTWLYVAALYALGVWLARRRDAGAPLTRHPRAHPTVLMIRAGFAASTTSV